MKTIEQWAALWAARRRWLRTTPALWPVPDRLRDGSGIDILWPEAVALRAAATRAEKKRWRRRLSRARHTMNTLRAVITFGPIPFGQENAIWLYDRPDDYPKITRAPWVDR